MGIYFGLIIFVLLLPIIVQPFCKTAEKRRHAIAFWGMLAIFLVLALKGDVGSDISGYKQQYIISAGKAWNDIDYVYFEAGYITFMKIFSKQGVDFQIFMVIIYAIACTAMYLFVKKYSKNPMLSLIIFIGYQFFVFYISGVRQTLAMSLCLIAFMIFQKRKLWAYILSFGVVLLSTTLHQSAMIFFVVLLLGFIKSKKINILSYIIALVLSFLVRVFVWDFIDIYLRHLEEKVAITLGGSFVMLCGIAVFMYLTHARHNIFSIKLAENEVSENEAELNAFFTRAVLACLCANIILSGNSLLRAAMYLSIFIVPGLPNTTHRLNFKFRVLLEYAFVVFFVAVFYFETLAVNQLELLPYVFFWE